MPTAPEVSHRSGEVRLAEIGHEIKSHDASDSDGNVGIAGEIAIDLDGEEECCNQEHSAGLSVRIVIYALDKRGDQIGDSHLLENTPQG